MLVPEEQWTKGYKTHDRGKINIGNKQHRPSGAAVQTADVTPSLPEEQKALESIVITDMMMPRMTGATLAEKLMAMRKETPITISSGHSAMIDDEKAKALGISAYAMKPVVKSAIARAIRTVLGNKIKP